MADENSKDLFQRLKQLSANDKIREALDPVKCLTQASQIRSQADRIRAAARDLAAGEKGTAWVMTALDGVREMFGPMEGICRGMWEMLRGLANRELAANYTLTMPGGPAKRRSPFLAKPSSRRYARRLHLLQIDRRTDFSGCKNAL
jgi:hypothetical protein